RGRRADGGRTGSVRGGRGQAAPPLPRRAEEAGDGGLPPPGRDALPPDGRRRTRRARAERADRSPAQRGCGLMRWLAAPALLPTVVHAHGMRTAYLELIEQPGGTVLATWRTTVADRTVAPRFPVECTTVATPGGSADGNERTTVLRCPQGLAGAEIAVDGL